jgi:hypothetical protein
VHVVFPAPFPALASFLAAVTRFDDAFPLECADRGLLALPGGVRRGASGSSVYARGVLWWAAAPVAAAAASAAVFALRSAHLHACLRRDTAAAAAAAAAAASSGSGSDKSRGTAAVPNARAPLDDDVAAEEREASFSAAVHRLKSDHGSFLLVLTCVLPCLAC